MRVEPRCVRAIGAIAFTLALGATCQPPADTDGLRTGAAPLPLQDPRADQLWCPAGCGGKGGDCADWWLVNVQKSGKLHVKLENQPWKDADGKPKDLDPRVGIVLELVDHDGAALGRAEAVGAAPAALTAPVAPGTYYALVEPLDPKRKGPEPYQIEARVELPKPPPSPPPQARPPSPPPPPPAPRVQTLTTPIVELEGPAGRPTAVLLDAGRSAGLRSGLVGRIVDHGQTIAPIEVIEVFDGGSRARLTGPTAGRITPSSEVQIDVPAAGP